MNYESPFDLLNDWIKKEEEQGAPNPWHAVLSTSTTQAIPHARVLAIREILNNSFIFFTQSTTRKVKEISENPLVSLTFWFGLSMREIIIEAEVIPLSDAENQSYWESYPRLSQLRFYSYAPTSTQLITDKQVLEDKKIHYEQTFAGKPIPMHPDYCGFRLIPHRWIFYAFRMDQLSDVIEFQRDDHQWRQNLLSP